MKKIKAPPIILCICLVLVSVIGGLTTMYGDDLIYAAYFSDGFKSFVSHNIYHYMNLNGRIFVHLFLEIVLIFRDRLFFIVVPSMLLAAFYMLSELLVPKKQKIIFAAYGIMGVMCLSPHVLREGMLWMAGAFNYIFPLSFAFGAFYMVIKTYETEKVRGYYYPLALISGATTEQCAVIAISASTIYIAYRFAKDKKINIKSIALTLAMCAGLLTIMLAPGTVARAGREAAGGTGDIIERLGLLYKSALSDWGILWVFLLTEAVFACKMRKKALTAAAIAVQLILCLCGKYLVGGIVLTVTLLVFAAGLLREKPKEACMLFAALLSIGMMVIADSFGMRNYMPALVIMIALCAEEFSKIKGNLTPAIAFCLSLAVFAPTLCGYASNRKIINENIANLEKTDGSERYYNADINPLYGYYQFYADSFYAEGMKKAYHINDKIFIRGKDFKDLYINGIHLENPEYIKDGTAYYPMRGVLEAYGAALDYNGSATVIEIGGRTVFYDGKTFSDGEKKVNADGYRLYDTKYGNMFNSNVYLNKKAFEEIFSINL